MQGDGTFLWQRRYTSEGPISVADIDRDGDVEIALCGLRTGPEPRLHLHSRPQGPAGRPVARAAVPRERSSPISTATARPRWSSARKRKSMAVRADGSTVWKSASRRSARHRRRALRRRSRRRRPERGLRQHATSRPTDSSSRRVYAFDHKGKPADRRRLSQDDHGRPDAVRPADRGHRRRRGEGADRRLRRASRSMAWEADGSMTPGFPMLNLSPTWR